MQQITVSPSFVAQDSDINDKNNCFDAGVVALTTEKESFSKLIEQHLDDNIAPEQGELAPPPSEDKASKRAPDNAKQAAISQQSQDESGKIEQGEEKTEHSEVVNRPEIEVQASYKTFEQESTIAQNASAVLSNGVGQAELLTESEQLISYLYRADKTLAKIAVVEQVVDKVGQDVVSKVSQDVVSKVSQDVVSKVSQDVVSKVGQDVMSKVSQDVVSKVSQDVMSKVGQDASLSLVGSEAPIDNLIERKATNLLVEEAVTQSNHKADKGTVPLLDKNISAQYQQNAQNQQSASAEFSINTRQLPPDSVTTLTPHEPIAGNDPVTRSALSTILDYRGDKQVDELALAPKTEPLVEKTSDQAFNTSSLSAQTLLDDSLKQGKNPLEHVKNTQGLTGAVPTSSDVAIEQVVEQKRHSESAKVIDEVKPLADKSQGNTASPAELAKTLVTFAQMDSTQTAPVQVERNAMKTISNNAVNEIISTSLGAQQLQQNMLAKAPTQKPLIEKVTPPLTTVETDDFEQAIVDEPLALSEQLKITEAGASLEPKVTHTAMKQPVVQVNNMTVAQMFSEAQSNLTQHNMQLAQQSAQALEHSVVSDVTQLQKNNVQLQQETISIFRKDFADAVKDKVMLVISQKLQQFDITLDPPEFGNMQVRVNLQGEQAAVNFVVQNQHAKEAFEQNMHKLREMLSEQGVDVGGANVEQQDSQTANEEHGSDQKDEVALSEQAPDAIAHVLSANLVNSSATGVDYYV